MNGAFLTVNTIVTQTLAQWQLTNPLMLFFWAVTLLSLHKAAFRA